MSASTPVLPHLRRSALATFALIGFVSLVGAVTLMGCGSDDGATPAVKPQTTTTGGFAANIDGKAVSIDYGTGTTTATFTHKINEDKAGYGCVTTAVFTIAKADGSCALELTFQPSAATSLTLASATFYAAKATAKQGDVVLKTLPCAGFPGLSSGEESIWTLAGGDSTLSVDPVPPGQANKTATLLTNLDLQLNGTIKLKNGGKQFDLVLDGIRIQGSIASAGSTQVSCGTATGKTVCPKKVTYGNTVGTYIRRPLGAFRCDDNTPYDPGEMCGNKAQLVISYQHWVTEKKNWGGKDILEGLAKTLAKIPKVSVTFVVLTGTKKVIVETSPGKFEATGPAPTQADCASIRKLYKLPARVVMVYDKDKALTSTEKQPVGVGFTPAVAVATSLGKITTVMPDKDGKMDQAMFDAAVLAAIEAK